MFLESLSDFFNDPASWQIIASGEAEGHLSSCQGPNGKLALKLDFDFHGSGGFVVARKEIHFSLPETYCISFALRGLGLPNNFEFKVSDPSATNAWRYLRENYKLPTDWTACEICERDLPFAWGPAGGGSPSVISAIELVIAAGPGGSGSIWFADLSIDNQTLTAPVKVSASSHLENHLAESVFQENSPNGWQAAEDDPAPHWSVDFGRILRFGGMIIDWPASMPPRCYQIEISADGETWMKIYQASHAKGLRSYVSAHHAEARFVRFNFANAHSAALRSLHLRPDSFSQTPNEFIHAVAKDYPRGWFPRYWLREQSYWTPIGTPEGRRRGLINEEGMVEVDEAKFSLEPFLIVENKLITWADVSIDLSLSANGAPFPVVTWKSGDITLRIMPWVDGADNNLNLRVNYQLENLSAHPIQLAVTVRPFQVNPPWQAFRDLGGRSPIYQIESDAYGMTVDGRRVTSNKKTDTCGAVKFEEGGVVEFLSSGDILSEKKIIDDSGLASAAMTWIIPADIKLSEITITVPFFSKTSTPELDSRANAIADWQQVLAPVEWRVPSLARSAVECFRTAASHILINRDGPAIQPGPRRYTRSWVRDCVIMGAAMAKVNHPHVLREFLLWYVQFQRPDGYVPCVVDRDGVDDLVENDSHGQLIWGICEVYRNERNLEFVNSMWQATELAAEYLIRLRAQRMTPEFSEPTHSSRYGLLPESASHEGYLAHPVHSYWDDFWGIRGLEAAAELAKASGRHEQSSRWQSEARTFLTDVMSSMDRVIKEHKISYIPGSVEWADFDPTATSNAIAQLDFADDLPVGPLHEMLDTYLSGFRQKHRGEIPWLNYTAYEIRIIGAFVRLGKRAEAHELLDVFLSDRRPIEWNQWPEITWRDARAPGHLGDVPHTWIAAEYMLALISMVVSEREESNQLVLASGLPWEWIALEDGFYVRGLATRYGRLEFHMTAQESNRICFSVGNTLSFPSGGLIVTPPLPPGMRITNANCADGHPLLIHQDGLSVNITTLPIKGILQLGASDETTFTKHEKLL
ncbi:MAG: discoidin domain-containing protein [Akkermansiaceae bacterium]|nr:discoidin domain-containing protein [Akkermansiaceae bacterium]